MEGSGYWNRREFLRLAGLSGMALLLGGGRAFSAEDFSAETLTILHTNDVHSRLEPFPMDGSKNQGLGGAAARSQLINSIRKEKRNVLVFDSGDALQGTPYFNFFQGEPEFKTMSAMGYNAMTIGNHEFDGGMENLAKLAGLANFPLICSNYDFRETPLDGKIAKSIVIRKGKIKIGIYGLGIELKGLVPSHLYGKTVYLDPLAAAKEQEYLLKRKQRCNLVICLSHLGFEYKTPKISDISIAKETKYTDVILGGHTHTFMKEPMQVINTYGRKCNIFQSGWGGITMGRLDISFSRNGVAEVTHAEPLKIILKNV